MSRNPNVKTTTRSSLFKVLLITSIVCSCNSKKTDLYIIEPSAFTENNISLSDISDEIRYIPLDNRYPIAFIYRNSINIVNKSIYLSVRDYGIIRFNNDGSMPLIIGKKGRGPGEWKYCFSIAVDDRSETIYIMDADNEIKAYYKNGDYKGAIKLPESEDGYNFSGITYFNSSLFASQNINMGRAKYNWIIMDTLGNILNQNLNSIPAFKANMGDIGGTFKFEDKISYWNMYNDTIYKVSPKFDSRASIVLSLGEGKMPMAPVTALSPAEYRNIMAKYYMPVKFFETNKYLFYQYAYNKKLTLALIEKESSKTYLTYYKNINGGIKNDIDGGLSFGPEQYYTENEREYLVGILDPFELKKYVNSDEFINSVPKYPGKKLEFEKLANSLKETDNPVLMQVRLKK